MRTLYLCGAINGCTDAQAKDWREATKAALAGHYKFLDPMRRDFRGREDDTVAEIVEGDLLDLDQSDVVLVAADRASWGTGMECFYSAREGLEVVVVCGAERVSPWLRYHASVIFKNLESAVTYLRGQA